MAICGFLILITCTLQVLAQSPCSNPCVRGGFGATCVPQKNTPCPPCYKASGSTWTCFDKVNGGCPWSGMTDCTGFSAGGQTSSPPPKVSSPPPKVSSPPPKVSSPPPKPATPPPSQPLKIGKAVQHLEFQNVGGRGSYNKVVDMIPNGGVWNQCPDPGNKCKKTPVQVSGPLEPFSEEQTVAFRGPMSVYDVAVYEPNDSSWKKVASWKRGISGNNLAWMVNSGDWSICHGNAQAFASPNGKSSASSPQIFSGDLANDVNVNILSGIPCMTVGVNDPHDNCPGFERGVARQGWRGNSCGEKMFAFRVQMPNDYSGSTNNRNLPAIWLLNGQIVRTNQWGCNCRGVGSSGGCGEFDIVEAIPGKSDQDLFTTLYSFKQSLGANKSFKRPSNRIATYLTILDGSGTGKIHVVELPDGSFPFSDDIRHSDVLSWTAGGATNEIVVLSQPYNGAPCGASIFLKNPKAVEDGSEASFSSTSPAPSSLTALSVIVVVCIITATLAIIGFVVLVKKAKTPIEEETV